MGDIKTRFVLEGEAAFRAAMNESASAVKKLNAEQKLAEAQFRQTGDAEAFLTAQSRILQEKLSAQNDAVKAAGTALAQIEQAGGRGSKAWDTWNMKLLAAQTAATKTETEIQNLGNSMDSTAKETDALEQSLGSIEKHTDFKAVINGIEKITGAMENAAKKAVQFGKRIYSAEVDASVWADDLITQSTAYNIDIETLQRWEYAAQFVDTEVGAILKARDRLIKSSQTKTGYGIIEELGIDPDSLSTMDLFWTTLNKLQDAGDNQENWSQELFGRSFRDLMPLLQAGREEWEKWAEQAPILDEEKVKNLGEANDALNKMNSAIETTRLEMLSALAPAFTDLANAITTFIDSEDGQKAIGDITNMLTDGMQWLIENKDDVLNTVTTLGAAFAGLKVSSGVLTFVDSLQGLKNLFNGGKNPVPTVPTTTFKTTPTTQPTTQPTRLPPVGLELLGGLGGITTAFMLTGGVAVGLSKLIYNEETDINKANRVRNADYTQEDYEALTKWIDLTNKITENMLTLTEDEYKSLESERGEIMSKYGDGKNDLFNKYFDYLTANDLDAAKFDILPQLEEMGLKAPLTLDPDTESLQTELSGTTFSANLMLNPQFPSMAEKMMIGFPHANGLSYVPYDGYPAILHRGERVLTRQENTNYNNGANGADLVRAMKRALSSVGIYMGSERVGNLTSGTVSGNISRETSARLRGFGG